jgi:hypothetical protein
MRLEPGVEGGGGEDAESGHHAVVAEAADLRAENGVVTGDFRGEVDVGGLAGDGVLLETHLGDGETVDNVLGAKGEIDLAAGGKDELAGDEIVVAVAVVGVDTEGIAFGWGDEGELGIAKGCVKAGVAEVPDELHPGDFDLHGGEVGSGVTLGGPEAFGAEGEEGEEEGLGGLGVLVDMVVGGGAGGARTEGEAEQKDEVREGEEAKSDPEIEEEVRVERVTVLRCVYRQIPEAVGWRDGLCLHGLIVECAQSVDG